MPVLGIYFHSGSLPQRRRSRDARTDLTDHTKTTIVVYLEYLLNIYAVHGSNILLWSDGPRSQFKNRFMARFMEMSEENHASNIRWNFFATSHGKGAVDGVGGVLMRRAWNKVKARQVVIRNVAEFTDAVKDGGIICNFFTEYPREVPHVCGLEYCVNMMHPSGSATGGLTVKKMKSTTTKLTLWRPLLHQYLLDPGEHLVSPFKHDKFVFV